MVPRCDPSHRDPGRTATLRRYLRAVLGDQALGDRLAAALEAGARDGCGLPVRDDEHGGRTDSRDADLICGAMRRWRRMHSSDARAAPFTPAAIARAVSPSANLTRQAGILVDVFGLSVADAATALDRSEGEIIVLLAAARVAASTPLNDVVLIIKADPVAREDLARIAWQAGARAVIAAPDAEAAYEAAAARPPGIALCDDDLGPGQDGDTVLARLAEACDCVGILVTGRPEEALSGTQGEPAFVIAKPFTEGAVRAALAYAASADRPDVLAA